MKRGDKITNIALLLWHIDNGLHFFHDKTVIMPAQARQWPVGKLISTCRAGKIYMVKGDV